MINDGRRTSISLHTAGRSDTKTYLLLKASNFDDESFTSTFTNLTDCDLFLSAESASIIVLLPLDEFKTEFKPNYVECELGAGMGLICEKTEV